MRQRTKTLPTQNYDPGNSEAPVQRRATYWESSRPINAGAQPVPGKKSISPPHKRLQFSDLPIPKEPAIRRMTQIHALTTILPRAESPASSVHADEDLEMQAILQEVSDIMSACRPVYQVRSSSELKSALKKNRSQFPLLPEHKESRHWAVGRRSEGQQKSLRLIHSKGIRRYGTPQRTLDTKETGQSIYLLSESTESLSRSKDLKRQNRLKQSVSKDALDADPGYDGYSPLRHRPQTLISPGSGLGRKICLRKGTFGPVDLPSKSSKRKFNKTETEARDYLEKLEDVITHQINTASNRRLCL